MGVGGRVVVIGSHVLAHDLCSVAGNVETALEAVLQAQAGSEFGVDTLPGRTIAVLDPGLAVNFSEIGHVGSSRVRFVFWKLFCLSESVMSSITMSYCQTLQKIYVML